MLTVVGCLKKLSSRHPNGTPGNEFPMLCIRLLTFRDITAAQELKTHGSYAAVRDGGKDDSSGSIEHSAAVESPLPYLVFRRGLDEDSDPDLFTVRTRPVLLLCSLTDKC